MGVREKWMEMGLCSSAKPQPRFFMNFTTLFTENFLCRQLNTHILGSPKISKSSFFSSSQMMMVAGLRDNYCL